MSTETHKSAAQAFYEEVQQLKPRLPKDWKLRLVLKNPQYDSYKGGVLLHNIINCKSTDPTVLQLLKEIIEEFETESPVMSGLKDYQIEGQCVHFIQAALIPGCKNEAEAREKFKVWVYKHHCNYPGKPLKIQNQIKHQCARTCSLKMTVTEIDTTK
jgi:hypothetical protein